MPLFFFCLLQLNIILFPCLTRQQIHNNPGVCFFFLTAQISYVKHTDRCCLFLIQFLRTFCIVWPVYGLWIVNNADRMCQPGRIPLSCTASRCVLLCTSYMMMVSCCSAILTFGWFVCSPKQRAHTNTHTHTQRQRHGSTRHTPAFVKKSESQRIRVYFIYLVAVVYFNIAGQKKKRKKKNVFICIYSFFRFIYIKFCNRLI